MQTTLEKKVSRFRKKIKRIQEEMKIQPRHTADGHFYFIPKVNEVYGSVSAEHRNIKDPSLRNFEKNEVVRFIKEHWFEFEQAKRDSSTKLDGLFKQALESPIRVRDTAGSIGSFIHNAREAYFRHWIESSKIERPNGSIEDIAKSWKATIHPDLYLDVISGCAGLDKFITEKRYIPLGCEIYVYDEKAKVAGTLDDVGLMPLDGQFNYNLCLLDVKSSNQLKDTFTLQVCRYLEMFKKLFRMFPRQVLIVKTSKNDRTYELEVFKADQIKAGYQANRYLNKFNKCWDNIINVRKKEFKVI